MHKLLNSLKTDYPNLVFMPSKTFYWSPRQKVIHYAEDQLGNEVAGWSLLHELSHAILEHQSFNSDFELLLLEVAAWEKAEALSVKYGQKIDPDHIQDCIDTYRDWLYQRSTCPNCTSCSLQTDVHTYQCHNCKTNWQVSSSRLCRPYRRKTNAVPTNS